MEKFRIGVIVGSLSSNSINRKLAQALQRLAPDSLVFKEISFRELPLYSQDYDADFPPAAREWKAALDCTEAVLFVTPEYNRSIPGGLKNAIDWASRPYGQNSFDRKPSAVIGTSPGQIATAVAQQHLRSLLSFCNSPQMNSPEATSTTARTCSTRTARSSTSPPPVSCTATWPTFAGFVQRCYMVLPRRDGSAPAPAGE